MVYKRKIILLLILAIVLLTIFIIRSYFWEEKLETTSSSKKTSLSEKDITPANMNGVRPDVVRIGDNFYVNFLETKPKRSFGLIKIDSNLDAQYLGEVYSGPAGSSPTDARMSVDGANNLWYPFEAVYINPDKNYLNLARYSVNNQTLSLIDSKDKIALGSIANPKINKFPESGTEQVDDPLPFYYNGKYYVMTKTFAIPVYKVRVFDNNLSLIDSYILDLAPVVGQNALSVSSLVSIENEIYMITGVFNNRPPSDPEATFKIIAIPLQNDLKKAKGAKSDLTDGKKYASYVSAAKYKDGKLYVLHDNFINTGQDGISHDGDLDIYDVTNNFSHIKTLKINGGKMVDNHMTMEFSGNKLCVFFNSPEEKLKVKIIDMSKIIQ